MGGVMKRTGGCLCGSVRFEVHGEPASQFLCHCDDCKRQTGSPFSVCVCYDSDKFKLLKDDNLIGHDMVGDSGKGLSRKFCGKCGAPILTKADMAPDATFIKMGAFDDPSWIRPTLELYTKDRVQCGVSALDMESHETMPSEF